MAPVSSIFVPMVIAPSSGCDRSIYWEAVSRLGSEMRKCRLLGAFREHLVFLVLEEDMRLHAPAIALADRGGLRLYHISRNPPIPASFFVEGPQLRSTLLEKLSALHCVGRSSKNWLTGYFELTRTRASEVWIHDPYLSKDYPDESFCEGLSTALFSGMQVHLLTRKVDKRDRVEGPVHDEVGLAEKLCGSLRTASVGTGSVRLHIHPGGDRSRHGFLNSDLLHARWICSDCSAAWIDTGFGVRHHRASLFAFPLPDDLRRRLLEAAKFLESISNTSIPLA
jgi:hypothetical protein